MTKFDLETRSTDFAKEVIKLCKNLKKGPLTNRLIDQVVGASGSIGANYREANDALGKQDFIHKLKISRRESKEAIHWLELILEADDTHEDEIKILINECTELRNILSSIITKTQV